MQGRGLKDAKEVRFRHRTLEPHRLPSPHQIQVPGTQEQSDLLKRAGVLSPIHAVGDAHIAFAGDEDQSVRVGKRQRTEQHTADHREDRGGGSDAEGESQHRAQGEARRLQEATPGDAHIVHESSHLSSPPGSGLLASHQLIGNA